MTAASAENRILLALSGGVDSAACARLLQQQGFQVHGLVLRFSPAHDAAVEAARRSADELGIPLVVGHCEEDFERDVVGPFCSAYASGHTPNPCVICNPLVKFRQLALHADRLGIEKLATGHYARIVRQGGTCYVATAASAARDQSYMLYRLPQSILRRLVLPAGEQEKAQLRGLAAQGGLSSANAPDSQDICFIPNGDYAGFIRSRGIGGLQGNFIGPNGSSLGPHLGVLHYTVGQRRGIGVALGRPVFVKAIAPNGDVQLAYGEDMLVPAMRLTSFVTTGGLPLAHGGGCSVKIRSVAKPVPCRVLEAESPSPLLLFATPQRAPAPGQHAVLYQGQLVVGGGVMAAAAPAPNTTQTEEQP